MTEMKEWVEFAKAALTGLCANDNALASMCEQSWGENIKGNKVLSRVCGQFADAMIKEKRRREVKEWNP